MKLKTKTKTDESVDSASRIGDGITNEKPNKEEKKKLKRKSTDSNQKVINDSQDRFETPIKKKKKSLNDSIKTPSNGNVTVSSEDISSEPPKSSKKRTKSKKSSESPKNASENPENNEHTQDSPPKNSDGVKSKTKKQPKMNKSLELPLNNDSKNIEKHENEQQKISEADKLSDEDEAAEPRLSAKEVQEISAKYLRTSFNTASGLSILRKFIKICNENTERDLAAEYIEKSGNVNEILRLLESDTKNLNNAALVLSGMQIVIMKILTKYPGRMLEAQEACRNFMNSHLSTVHSMMSNQSTPKQRKVVLRLLTSIVSLGESLPRELLAHLSFHQQTVALLSQQTKPSDPSSVRTCFIHFILSFLVNSEASVIRALLDKKGLLSSIFPELIYDSHATVHLVLTTIKTYVLENSAISKTMKLHVFSTPVVQNLVSLYNWKGPRSWPGPDSKKRKSIIESVNPDEQNIVLDAVDDFLTVLLTSNRHGIIFNDKSLGTSGKKHNQLVNTILQSMERPWDHEKPRDLVCKILVACPDLVKPQLTYTEVSLEPRPSKKWISVMNFVQRIIEDVKPENLKSSIPELTNSQLINVTVTLTMSSNVLKKAVTPASEAPSIILRHEAVTVLTVMLKQVRKFLKIAEENVSGFEYSNLRSNLREYILKNIPSVGDFVKIWRRIDEDEVSEAVSLEEMAVKPKKSQHFSAILDLIQNYYEVVEAIGDDHLGILEEKPQILLTSLNELEDIDEEELNFMKIKAIRLIHLLNPDSFAKDKFLGEALLFLILLLNNSEQLKFKVMETIKMMLKDSKVFKNCEDQMDIWFNSFDCIENLEERTEVAQWLVRIISKTVKSAEKYEEEIAEIEKQIGKKTGETESELLQPNTSIPPLLCAAVRCLQKKPNNSAGGLVAFVTSLTLHCQVSPKVLFELVKDIDDKRLRYVNSWTDGNAPIRMKKILSENVFAKFSKILLSNGEFAGEILEDGTGPKSSYEILNLIKMTVFYLTRLIQKETLTQENFDCHKKVMISLLDLYKNSEKFDRNCILEGSRHILTHPILLNFLNPIPKAKTTAATIVTIGLLEIIRKIVEINEQPDLHDLVLPFKNKLMSDLKSVLKKCVGGWTLRKTENLIEFIDVLQLKSTDLQELLRNLTNLPKPSFLTEDKKSLSIWGEVTPKVIDLLSETKKLEVIAELPKEAQMVHKLCIHFTHLKSTGMMIENWENSLLKFLETFPHHIAAVDSKTFDALLENKLNKSTIKLISFLTARNPKLIQLFTKRISTKKSAIEDHELVLSVLSSNLAHQWSPDFLNEVSSQYQQDIIDYFSFCGENKDWVNEHVEAVAYLISSCFSLDTCEKIATKILSSGDKLESVSLTYTILLQNLFTKLSQLHQNPQKNLSQFLQILIRLMASALKKTAKDDRIEALCRFTLDTIAKLRSIDNNLILEELAKNYAWPQFTRFSLRSGLKNSKDSTTPLLKTLAEVCNIAYEDRAENEYVKTLFEMTTSHSEFVNLMMSSQKTKKDLLQLIFILIKKNPTVMTSAHVPVYLSAYNATLSECDQRILMILHFYENGGINLTEYKPYLFGEKAASHYSVTQKTDTALWRQPSSSKVLEVFKIETVENTIRNFPVGRTLEPKELQCSENVYDPAFYLPLLLHLMSDNNVIACHNVTQSGALALVFAACGSSCPDIRRTAFTVLARFYFHVEATRSKEKLLWMRIIDALRNGIASLECPLSDVRLHCFISTFLAKSSLVATQPLNPLYAPLHKFFMAKEELDLKSIPEFLTLFNSSDINHKIHRHWILEVIRDGLKTNFDMEIVSKYGIFRTLLYFHGSILSDPETRMLILEVINAAVQIPKAGLLLCRHFGLLVWLIEASKKINPRNIEGIEGIVNIVRNMLDTKLNSNEDTHFQFMLLKVLTAIIPKLSRNTTVRSYGKFLNCFEEIMKSKSLCGMIHKNQIQKLIEVSGSVVGNVKDCEEVLIHSCEFVVMGKTGECEDDIMKAKCNLKNIVVTWRSQVKS